MRPYVILSAAMSIDGKIAAADGTSKISSGPDLEELHRLRGRVDAIMVGINTVRTDNPLLTNRSGFGKRPIRLVVDSRARIPITSRILSRLEDSKTIIACSAMAPPGRVSRLRKLGANVIAVDDMDGKVNLAALLRRLHSSKGVKRLLLEGGGRLNWSMLRQGLVDEVRVTVAPMIIGGASSKSLVGGTGVASISESIRLQLVSSKIRERTGEVSLSYKVIKVAPGESSRQAAEKTTIRTR